MVGYGCLARTTLQLWPRPATSATRTIVWLGAVLGWAGAHTWLSALPGSRLDLAWRNRLDLVSPATRLDLALAGTGSREIPRPVPPPNDRRFRGRPNRLMAGKPNPARRREPQSGRRGRQ